MLEEDQTILGFDDTKMLKELIDEEWSLGVGETPKTYYDWSGMARINQPGSFEIRSLGITPSRQGINMDSYKVTHRISIDLQCPINRERLFAWTRELSRILQTYRRAGKYQLHGWDYIDMTSWQMKSGSTAFYQAVLDISLVREVKPMCESGFGRGPLVPKCELE